MTDFIIHVRCAHYGLFANPPVAIETDAEYRFGKSGLQSWASETLTSCVKLTVAPAGIVVGAETAAAVRGTLSVPLVRSVCEQSVI